MLVLLVEHIFLSTFYGLYFNHQLHITISSSSNVFMVTVSEQLSCTASTPVFLTFGYYQVISTIYKSETLRGSSEYIHHVPSAD